MRPVRPLNMWSFKLVSVEAAEAVKAFEAKRLLRPLILIRSLRLLRPVNF